jgi:hypothetical protein
MPLQDTIDLPQSLISEVTRTDVRLEEVVQTGDGFMAFLVCGSKRMKISVHEQQGIVETLIKTNPDNTGRVDQETRKVYQAVNRFCQGLADTEGRPISYKLLAHHPTIQQWAATYSDDIFHWQQAPKVVPTGIQYTKVYTPRR